MRRPAHPDRRNRERVRVSLMARVAEEDPRLVAYQRHVLRWIDCAPEGALFLTAPLQGWDGTPLRSKEPQGPWGRYQKNLREARVARGLHPLGGRFGENGRPVGPAEAYASRAARVQARVA